MFFTDQMGNGTSLLVTTETTEYDLSQLHHIVLCGPTQLQGYLAIVWLIKLQQLQWTTGLALTATAAYNAGHKLQGSHCSIDYIALHGLVTFFLMSAFELVKSPSQLWISPNFNSPIKYYPSQLGDLLSFALLLSLRLKTRVTSQTFVKLVIDTKLGKAFQSAQHSNGFDLRVLNTWNTRRHCIAMAITAQMLWNIARMSSYPQWRNTNHVWQNIRSDRWRLKWKSCSAFVSGN